MSLLLLIPFTGVSNQVWLGSTAQVGASVTSGEFYSNFVWDGSIARIGVAGFPGVMMVEPLMVGSPAVIGIAGRSGVFSGEPMPFGTPGFATVGKGQTDTASASGRTAMMVGSGRARTGTR